MSHTNTNTLKAAYTLSLTEREKTTADWLDDHGYFGNFFQVATLTEGPEEDEGVTEYRYTLTEPDAWSFVESVEGPDGQGFDEAFLACNGCHTLHDKMMRLLESIV